MALAHHSNEWTLNGVLARGDPNIQRLTVSPMTSEDLGRMLVKQLGCKRIQHMALKLLHARSGGNPYFAQQLGAHMLQHGLLEIVPADVEDAAGDDSRQAAAAALLSKSAGDLDAASPPPSDMELRLATAVNWSTVRVPHTLERAIFAELTRVVTPAELFTLKIASVIGRTFSLEILYRVHPTPNFVQQHLRRLIELQYLEVPDGGGDGDNVDDDASGDRAPTPVSSTADPATRSSNARTRRLRRLSGSGISGSRGRRRSSASSGESEGMQPPPTPSGSGVAGDAAVPADAAAAAAAAVGSPRLMPPVPVRAGTGSSPNTPPVSSRHGQPLRQPVYVVVLRCVQIGPLAASRFTMPCVFLRVWLLVLACTRSETPDTDDQLPTPRSFGPSSAAVSQASQVTPRSRVSTATVDAHPPTVSVPSPGFGALGVAGGGSTPAVARRVCLPDKDELIGTSRDVTCQFRKLLVQEVLYQSLPFSHRTAMHKQVALALEEQLHIAEDTAADMVKQVRWLLVAACVWVLAACLW